MNISCNHSILFGVVLCISMIVPVKAGDSSSWPYYVGTAVVSAGVGIAVGAGGAIVVQNRVEDGLKRTVDHTEEKAEDFVNHLLGEKKEDPNSKAEGDDLTIAEKNEQVSPIEKVSDIFKSTVESTGHQLSVDLAQNVGRMMLAYTLGLFGAFFAYKQIVDYFAYQEKIDHLDIVAQEQTMLLLPQGNLSHFLQKREAILLAAKRKHFEHEQNRKFYLAGCGSLTFAAACGLCSYWIQ